MHCSACRHQNAADAPFCEECGGDLARPCASCGTANSPTAKFCKNCRASLADCDDFYGKNVILVELKGLNGTHTVYAVGSAGT